MHIHDTIQNQYTFFAFSSSHKHLFPTPNEKSNLFLVIGESPPIFQSGVYFSKKGYILTSARVCVILYSH